MTVMKTTVPDKRKGAVERRKKSETEVETSALLVEVKIRQLKRISVKLKEQD